MKLTMKNAASSLVALLAAAALCCTPLLAASSSEPAGETQTGSTTGFYVSARIPGNQTDTNLSYFSLLMAPEQQQVLEVEVVNEGDAEITVDVSAVSASTNPNGIIDYKTPDVRDDMLQNPFADLAEVITESIDIPAGGTGVASVRVTMPAGEFDGDILGSLVFTKRPPEPELDLDENGAIIQNVYSYAVGVLLRINDNAVEPDFELLTVEPNLFNNQPAFIHAIRNREPAVVKSAKVTASVYSGDDMNGTPVATRTQELVDMAPNSVLDFAVAPGDGTLEGGTYTTEVVVRLNGEEWRFTDSFMVQDDEATLVNDLAPFAPGDNAAANTSLSNTNTLLIVLVIALLAIVVILAIALVVRGNRNARQNR